MPIGPFGIMDQMGLKTVWTVADYRAHHTQDIPAHQLQANADFVKQYVDRGELGARTKKRFYSYPMPAYSQPGFLKEDVKK
ncbi:MAG: hypothetical protein K4571_07925 [Deltaproteobacteria bacterium]